MFSAEVNWTEPIATDNSGNIPTVTSNYQPPKRLSQGTHVIIYTAEDQSNNKATCSFTVEVTVINCTTLMMDQEGPMRVSSCGSHFGVQCKFSCMFGYRLNGSSTVTCVAPGNSPPGLWDSPLPKCQAITCPSLSSPSNGFKTGCTHTESETYNTHCSFTCNVGYTLIGSPVRWCLENGTWSGDMPFCQVINCGALNTPAFATVSPPSCKVGSNYSQTCRYACERLGYVLKGTSVRVCDNNGQWTGLNDTHCRDMSPPSFNGTCPNNTVFYATECSSSALVTWTVPVVTDNSGNVSISYPAIRPPVNLSIGLYNVLYSAIDSSGNRANCTFIVQVARKSCSILQAPFHGSITSLSCGFSYGSQASFSCDKGYRMAGSRQRWCRADGTWSGDTTLCNIVKCPTIATPPHRVVLPPPCNSISDVNYGTNCIFSCNASAGYQLEGPSNVSCLDSGLWSADTTKIICKDVQPPSIQCPRDMEISTETGQPFASVMWQVPDPTDNSNDSVNLSGLMPPQKLDVGNNDIKYIATDSAGLSGSCTFSIDVIDVEPPKIANCPDDVHKTSSEIWTKIFFPGVTVTDNVGIRVFETNRPNGSDFTWGEHNVTYTASDKAGNTAKCHFQVIITDFTCPELQAPLNGAKACETWLTGMYCTVHCNKGFGFVDQPEALYKCTTEGIWINAGKGTPSLPDCSKTHMPQEAVVNGDLHYLVDSCGGESMNEVIAGNFIELFRNSPFGMAGGCNGKCTIDNVRVECGNQTKARRRREIADGRETSKIPLTVHFSLKVPLPSNASLFDFNQTSQQISNNLLEALSETDLDLNISGFVIVHDSTKPPVFRLTSLVCREGQVQRGTRCVNCPLGYFFNTTGCQACAVDEYQDQEAQMSCLSCPSESTTFGKTASRWRENCQEIPNQYRGERQGLSKPILYSIIAAGACVLVVVISLIIFCVQKHCVAGKPTPCNERPFNHYPVDDVTGHSNPAYDTIPIKDPFSIEICEFQKCGICFDKMNYLSQDYAQRSPENDFKGLNFNQSEV